jgi:hypothetical protein
MARDILSEESFNESLWEPACREAFAQAWTHECDTLSPYRHDRIHLVTGLLLPVWKHLPATATRIYRLMTDDGRALIGRLIPPDHLQSTLSQFGKTTTAPINTASMQQSLLSGDQAFALRGGLTLKRARVMGEPRIELKGFDDQCLPQLKTLGLYSEIIAFTLRLFVPTGEKAEPTLAALLDRHPLQNAGQAHA